MRLRLLVASLLSLVVTSPAMAADWQHVGSSLNAEVYVDVESITQIKGGFEYDKIMTSETMNRKILSHSQMLCGAKKSRPVTYQAYTFDGEFITSSKAPQPYFNSIVVNSLEATLWEFLCE